MGMHIQIREKEKCYFQVVFICLRISKCNWKERGDGICTGIKTQKEKHSKWLFAPLFPSTVPAVEGLTALIFSQPFAVLPHYFRCPQGQKGGILSCVERISLMMSLCWCQACFQRQKSPPLTRTFTSWQWATVIEKRSCRLEKKNENSKSVIAPFMLTS